MANDRDPDGDPMRVTVPDPLPPGLAVQVEGNDLVVTALAGSASLVPFTYHVDDGHGHDVVGSVLVAVIAEVEPNRPPIANADAATAVAGTTQLIEVLLNDSDPDGDPLIVVEARSSTGAAVAVQGDRVRYVAPLLGADDDARIDRFAYTISDGNGHTADGEVTVRARSSRSPSHRSHRTTRRRPRPTSRSRSTCSATTPTRRANRPRLSVPAVRVSGSPRSPPTRRSPTPRPADAPACSAAPTPSRTRRVSAPRRRSISVIAAAGEPASRSPTSR
ncbi:MAG: Ig-like domain-containing protein [Ilumatobacteraceae bacterium]